MTYSPLCDDRHDTKRVMMARWCEEKIAGRRWPAMDNVICLRMLALARARDIAADAWPRHLRVWWRFRGLAKRLGGQPCLKPITIDDLHAAVTAIDDATAHD